ncbi:MAG: hypothetical protein Ct9H300mP12_16700 [Acidimicrobiales bacterium]|nr:MAG: hypothetical protein Ct9H300mP12_16700 [Acidimicrobiales bacterium]
MFPLDEGNNVKNLLRPPWGDDTVVDTVFRPGPPPPSATGR